MSPWFEMSSQCLETDFRDQLAWDVRKHGDGRASSPLRSTRRRCRNVNYFLTIPETVWKKKRERKENQAFGQFKTYYFPCYTSFLRGCWIFYYANLSLHDQVQLLSQWFSWHTQMGWTKIVLESVMCFVKCFAWVSSK